MESDKINSTGIAFIAISEKEFENMQRTWLSGPDWLKAKGRWITIRQNTKHGYMYRSLLAEDYVPFEEYSQSDTHSFIFLE